MPPVRPKEIAALLRPRPLRWRPTERRLARCHTIEDLRRVARRRLPRAVFDYVDGGAEDEVTLHRNREAFSALELVPTVLRDVDHVDPATTILGRPVPLPIVVAPTGFTRMVHHEGELAVARAAAARGLPYTLSTMSNTTIEAIAGIGGDRWFQLYVWRDRGLARSLVERAQAAGYDALVLTVDIPVTGARERDLRSGLTIPPTLGLRTFVDGALHPHWWWRFLTSDGVTFANVTDRAHGEPAGVMAYIAKQFDPTVTWHDVEAMVASWSGPFVLKGVMSVADARRAADLGVTALVVSNHGGRQLDHAPATMAVLPEIVDAVGDRVEVMVDGGVRRGSDVVKALALGARAVMIGRAHQYGLGAAGQPGVEHALGILETELRRTMALVGARTVAEIDRDVVRRHTPGWTGGRA
jgi:L-lactate dehydrogenase (cytochrome)